MQHWAIKTSNASQKEQFINTLQKDNSLPDFTFLKDKKGAVVSQKIIVNYIKEEEQHGKLPFTLGQRFQSFSSGEQKSILLDYLLSTDLEYLILDNIFDHLDVKSGIALRKKLEQIRQNCSIIQLTSRAKDRLAFISQTGELQGAVFIKTAALPHKIEKIESFSGSIPPAAIEDTVFKTLIKLENVNVSFYEKPILHNINWTIKPNQFWQLTGENGSGKTTLLSMLTGENPKAYGQNITLFGQQKGSGESIWQLKKHMGYFTPAMTDTFKGYQTSKEMLLSGFTDSIGLYTKASEITQKRALEWLQLLNFEAYAHKNFRQLTRGEQRLLLIARAMVKHPSLLILDEPTSGLDDTSAALVVDLINKMAQESTTSIVLVSHRQEKGLTPTHYIQLTKTALGSVATF